MPDTPPVMTAESESSMLLDARPVRISGWICLLLGLFSSLALLAAGLLVLAALAIVVGLYATRGYRGRRPVGYRAAVLGMALAILFSAWSLTELSLRRDYMVRHGQAYARDWLTLIQQGQIELACELQTGPSFRQESSISLVTYYRESERGREAMTNFREHDVYSELLLAGRQPQWTVERPATYYHRGNQHLVNTYWSDSTGSSPLRFSLTLQYYPPAEDGQPAEWSVQYSNPLRPDA